MQNNLDTKLIKAMRRAGYACYVSEEGVRLYSLPIRGFTSGYYLPGMFRSVYSAADSLIPVLGSDSEVASLVNP